MFYAYVLGKFRLSAILSLASKENYILLLENDSNIFKINIFEYCWYACNNKIFTCIKLLNVEVVENFKATDLVNM